MKYLFKRFCSLRLLFLFIFLGTMRLNSFGQCTNCITTINSNVVPVYTVLTGTTVCIASGFEYTGTIILDGGTFCNQGIVHNITFNSGTFDNYGIYSKTTGITTISNSSDLTINNYAGSSVLFNKLNITSTDLLNINIYSGSQFKINNSLSVSIVSNANQISVYDAKFFVEANAILSVSGDVNVSNGILQLENGINTNIICNQPSCISTINFSKQLNVLNNGSIALINNRNAILNIGKSISFSNSGFVNLTNRGTINISIDFNITGNNLLVGGIAINNNGTFNIARNFNVSYPAGVLTITNVTPKTGGGIFIGGNYSQTQDNTTFTNQGFVIVKNDVNISKGTFNNNSGLLQARTLFVKEGTLYNLVNTTIFLSKNLTIGNQAINNGLQSANVTNNGAIDVASVLNNKANLNLSPSSRINTTDITNQTQGIINRDFGISDKIFLKGNWLNNGTANSEGGGEVIFNGQTLLQTISGSIANQTFYILTMDKASGIVQLNSPVIINNTLNLTKGVIGSSEINNIELVDDAVVSGGSGVAYVHGPMKKTGNDIFTFPLGDTLLDTAAYHPLSITAPETSTDAYTARYFAKNVLTDNPNFTAIEPDSLQSIDKCEYFTLTRNAGNSVVIPTISWNANSCDLPNYEDMRVAGWDGNQWKSMGSDGGTFDGKTGTIKAFSGLSIATLYIALASKPAKPVPYFILKRTLNAGTFLVTKGTLKFKFDEEYHDTDDLLEFTIYNDKTHTVKTTNQLIPMPKLSDYGEKFYSLNLWDCGISPTGVLGNGYYILEVKNEKKEKWLLSFKQQYSGIILCSSPTVGTFRP